MKRQILLTTLISMLLILPQVTVLAATYYVDREHANANDSNPGTEEEQPLMTIQGAANLVQPGDTVIVKKGIYRETLNMMTSGTQSNPIVFRTDPANRAIISGAEVVANWQLLPGSNDIYYADLADVPVLPNWMQRRFLKEDQKMLEMARLPKEGWWLTEDATGTSLIDTLNLAQFTEASDLIGAECYYFVVNGNYDSLRTIVDYNPAAGEITFGNTVNTPIPGSDFYYLRNKLNLLTQPGEWVLDMNMVPPRIYVRPSDSGDVNDHIYEYAVRENVINLRGQSYLTIEGFEIRDSYLRGLYAGATGLTLRNCLATGIPYQAAPLSGSDIVVKDNVFRNNAYGLTITSAENALVEHNHIFDGYVDGLVVSGGSNNVRISDNFIHDHVLWGHPDNIQFHSGVTNVTVEDNVIFNGGQSMMLENTSGGQICNNLIVGSVASSLNLGHNSSYPYKITGNTIALNYYHAVTTTAPTGLADPVTAGFPYDFEIKNNIIASGHSTGFFFTWANPNVSTDFNLFAQEFWGYYEDSWLYNLVEWQGSTGLDGQSQVGNPLFVNAPEYFSSTARYPYLHTREKICLDGYEEYFEVGDHIEINFDGVDRTVTATGSQPHTDRNGNPVTVYYIEISPPLAKTIQRYAPIANWKQNPVSELDFRVQRQVNGYAQDSPAIGMGEGGINVGCEIDLPTLRRADFDGDGIIDDPRFRGENILYGDVSENGAISATDASMAARYAVGLISLTAEQITKADVTGNASVSATDASWIARKAVNPNIAFPVE